MANVTVKKVEISLTIAQNADNTVSIVEQPTSSVTVQTTSNNLEVCKQPDNTVEINQPSNITVEIANATVIQPPPVDEATKLVIVRTAGENINAWQWVRLISATEVVLCSDDSYDESLAVGIALETRTTGQSIRILTLGIAEDPSFTYALNAPIFLADSGGDTVTPTTTVGEFVTQVAQSLGPGAINITIGKPVEIL